jgi:hypothetical protein
VPILVTGELLSSSGKDDILTNETGRTSANIACSPYEAIARPCDGTAGNWLVERPPPRVLSILRRVLVSGPIRNGARPAGSEDSALGIMRGQFDYQKVLTRADISTVITVLLLFLLGP